MKGERSRPGGDTGSMRILHMIPTLGTGGAERLLASLAPELKRLGHSVGIVSEYDRRGQLAGELESQGIEVRFLGKRRGLDPRMVPRMARAIRSFRPDVVHSHSAHVLRYAIPAVLLSRACPIVHTLHTMAERESDEMGKLLQFLAFRAGVTPVAIGQAVAESVRRVYRLAPRYVIPNGIPVSSFASSPGSREELRATLALPHPAPIFVTVGRLVEAKDHASLLEAFASDRLRSLGAHLLLVGDGELRASLEERSRSLGLGERIHFLGNRPDVARLLHAADVFVLSSRQEGNPLSVMEAMAAGRPVVATSVGCVPELVCDDTGRLVAPGDSAGLERAMFELASDLALTQAKGRAAARVARERFDISVMARAYERLYHALLPRRYSARLLER